MTTVRPLAAIAALASLLALEACAGARCGPCDGRVAAAPPSTTRPPASPTAGGLPQVFVDTTFVYVPESVAARAPAVASVLTEAEATELRTAWTATPDVAIVVSPKILTLLGQEATIFVGETYVSDGTQPPIAYDVDGETWAGQRVRVTADSIDASAIHLVVSFADRVRPPNGSKPDLTAIAAGEVRASGALTIRPGETHVLVATRGDGAAKQRVHLLVTARALAPGAS